MAIDVGGAGWRRNQAGASRARGRTSRVARIESLEARALLAVDSALTAEAAEVEAAITQGDQRSL